MKRFLAGVLAFGLAILLTACTSQEGILAHQTATTPWCISWQDAEGTKEGVYTKTASGFTFLCHSQNGTPMVWEQTGGSLTLTCEGITVVTEKTPLLTHVEALFSIPEDAIVTSVSKEGSTRLITMTHGDVVYMLTMEGDIPHPTHLAYETPKGNFSMTLQKDS